MNITRHGAFNVATKQGVGGWFIAWAKMGQIQGSDPLSEPGSHVWFNFGRTQDEAKGKLLAELGLPAISP